MSRSVSSMSREGGSSISGTLTRSGTASFRDRQNRFTEYPDIRHRTSFQAEERSAHIGPGSYDPSDRILSPVPRARSPVMYRQVDSKHTNKTFVSDAPPVGTYQIPRALTFDTSKKHKLSACFETSGRARGLMPNGKVFQTLNEEATLSNVGPGMYDLSSCPSFRGRQQVNPTISDRRYRANRARDAAEREMRPQQRASTAPTPSRLGSIFSDSSRTDTPSPTPSHPVATSVCSISPIERIRDIESVRNLPDYPNR